MEKKLILGIISIILLISCNNPISEKTIEIWKQEILDTEKEFSDMASKEGIPNAFLFYSTEDVVLMRNNKLIKGKSSMEESFMNSPLKSDNVTLTWKPTFVDVSASGDLGYTYGTYTYTVMDSLGNSNENKGIFHTVWKRQKDGKWRFVYD